MESPPSFSTNSEAPPLSEDSGLLITSGSFSSDSASGWHHVASELQESDFDERSLSLCESTETSERMCGDFFNTVKKGPGKVVVTTIEPPPEFQDNPVPVNIDNFTAVYVPPTIIYSNESATKSKSSSLDIPMSTRHVSPIYPRKLKPESLYERRQCLNHRFASPRLLHLSPCRTNRPSSRNSLSSRLSSSHNSLVTQFQADDSSFITQAISHDTLSAKTSDITDMYNVPFDSDIYAVPIDMVRPSHVNTRSKGKKFPRSNKKRGKSTPQSIGTSHLPLDRNHKLKETSRHKDVKTKRHSLPSSTCKKSATDSDTDSLHLTLREMRKYLHTLYSSSSDSECRNTMNKKNNTIMTNVGIHSRHSTKDAGATVFLKESNEGPKSVETNNNHKKTNKNSFGMNAKNKKHKENIPKDIIEVDKNDKTLKKMSSNQNQKVKMSPVRILSINLKQSFCNLFRWRRQSVIDNNTDIEKVNGSKENSPPPAVRRALPPLPLPQTPQTSRRPANEEETVMDFATSIQKVKDYGWYWGPISVETAEKILSNEPDGSFIVRDSSDDHYIFTLTFKLNGLRHVRIEHDQGNFCFGGCTMFKAQTIVEFIENAVETSRSGRYLFFLNLRPVLGPVRVQLLYPVSRFKRVQSLQHMCRFVILKHVRRDLISNLPLPRRLLDYLSATHYYAELLGEI
ncbi:uncharacterized protein LOC113516487 isoform X1 [Galleria mellonella]|uniref:Uncharacterized protein LOC113516487 isoform X1 n=2 Tax=Galleria mellonella TaxID=7137 RepID=A0A6J1WVE0_GALME|nr:uncharacterized protein LOC113516487 isoform X1 [Galleria mellonella]